MHKSNLITQLFFLLASSFHLSKLVFYTIMLDKIHKSSIKSTKSRTCTRSVRTQDLIALAKIEITEKF